MLWQVIAQISAPLNRDIKTRSKSRNRSRRHRSQRRQRNQRGGDYSGGYGNYSFTGPAGVSTGGVPFESRAANNEHCGWTLRPAPQLGGRRNRNRSRKPRGGCCCGLVQGGGGGGTGGHGFELNNSLGKVYASLPVGPCPATPVATQQAMSMDTKLLPPPGSPNTWAKLSPSM